ncbi:hypothetical protein PLICRDRAFT_176791 [Plicaturopsis crispa FD-325 SS-3]|nr:hypothetical protein PLICRDRAFT_176791 [Plicaturopsis crispa FD-325 SS-3]
MRCVFSESKDSPRSERRDESLTSGASQDGAASPIGASPVEAPESVESGPSASRPLADTAQRRVRTLPDPPRIPTPDIEDVEMPHYVPIDDAAQPPSPPTQAAAPAEPSASDDFRETMERVGAFDSEISALRRSISRSPPIAPSSASVPTLPPLEELPPLETATTIRTHTCFRAHSRRSPHRT